MGDFAIVLVLLLLFFPMLHVLVSARRMVVQNLAGCSQCCFFRGWRILYF